LIFSVMFTAHSMTLAGWAAPERAEVEYRYMRCSDRCRST
jgi:hypothetical protein